MTADECAAGPEWFGKPWNRHNHPMFHRETPVGELCMYCEKQIEPESQGLLIPYIPACKHALLRPWHIDCFIQSIGGKP